ncbi:MAG: dCTP deaminase [Anaerolineae bacterium]|nr:dCTP deaminase [Anaerolineae bacterium]
MIFSDRDIRRLLAEGAIRLDPPPDLDLQLGSCSLDLRLGKEFGVFEHNRFPYVDIADPRQPQHITKEVCVENGESFVLHPGTFVLAVTVERLELADDIVARLEGRSSLGRLGIVVHATASIIDPGWRGRVVLELANHGQMPVALYPGMRICALTFEPVSTPVDLPYWRKTQAKYAEQTGPTPSRISDDPEVHKEERE